MTDSFNRKSWQKLLSLESRDIVGKWFQDIHGRELNARRSKEIIAAARQAREFFRNSADSNFSVKPLLTFYGVASLSRSLTLLLKADGGEETLTSGHGLDAISWSNTLSGEISLGLKSIGSLKIKSSNGLFSEFLKATENTIMVHVRSSAVDWKLSYPIPPIGAEVQLHDLLARLPDLSGEYSMISHFVETGWANNMAYSDGAGFVANIACDDATKIASAYEGLGYSASPGVKNLVLQADTSTFNNYKVQMAHKYIDKQFGSIPVLSITTPYPGNNMYSQLATTYMVAYILGMLARYFPTHWTSLIQGEKGDALWPTINRAHQLVEETFPELVAEFIAEVISQHKPAVPSTAIAP